MSGRQLLEWKAYSEIEPFGEERADLRLAAVLRTLFSIHRDAEKTPDVPGLGVFYGSFLADIIDLLEPKVPKGSVKKHQTWQEQKAILLEWAASQAALYEAQQQRRKARA